MYSEKPLAAGFDQARALVDLARARGRVLGCAPDTPFGTGFQASRKALLGRAVGRPLAAVAHTELGRGLFLADLAEERSESRDLALVRPRWSSG